MWVSSLGPKRKMVYIVLCAVASEFRTRLSLEYTPMTVRYQLVVNQRRNSQAAFIHGVLLVYILPLLLLFKK